MSTGGGIGMRVAVDLKKKPVQAAAPATTAPVIATPGKTVAPMNQPESGTIPATVFAPNPTTVAPVATSALPAMAAPIAATPAVDTNNVAQPVVVSAADPTFAKQIADVSPFTDRFGNVDKGSWDSIFNSKLTAVRAKDTNAANVAAFEAGSGRVNSLSTAKNVNDAPSIADAANATRVSAENAQNATAIATNALTNKTAAETNAADIKARKEAADIAAQALSKQAQVHPVGQHLEGAPGFQVPVTDYGMLTMDATGNPKVTPIAGANSKSVATNAPPPGHIAALKQNPTLAADFDAKYGEGAAAAVLGK